MNVTVVISDILMWLQHQPGYENTQTFSDVMSHFNTTEQGESFVLRLLVHYVGDSHQPLHSINRVNADYPEGDKGGNIVPIPSYQGASNLHAFWDSDAYTKPGKQSLPLTYNAWTYTYTPWADDIRENYPVDQEDWNVNDPWAWQDEIVALANDVYNDAVVENEPLSDAYVAQALIDSER